MRKTWFACCLLGLVSSFAFAGDVLDFVDISRRLGVQRGNAVPSDDFALPSPYGNRVDAQLLDEPAEPLVDRAIEIAWHGAR